MGRCCVQRLHIGLPARQHGALLDVPLVGDFARVRVWRLGEEEHSHRTLRGPSARIALPFRGRSAARAARIELAIRGWARRDPMARQAVDEVDARRISYHAQCFSALGFRIPEARARAFALYAYEVAEFILSNQGNAAQKAERSALVERSLLTVLDEPV